MPTFGSPCPGFCAVTPVGLAQISHCWRSSKSLPQVQCPSRGGIYKPGKRRERSGQFANCLRGPAMHPVFTRGAVSHGQMGEMCAAMSPPVTLCQMCYARQQGRHVLAAPA
eukprot:1152307-Pelagomonas_calceolata.AAC.5